MGSDTGSFKQMIDEVLAYGGNERDERPLTKEERDILTEIDLGLASETVEGKTTLTSLKNSK